MATSSSGVASGTVATSALAATRPALAAASSALTTLLLTVTRPRSQRHLGARRHPEPAHRGTFPCLRSAISSCLEPSRRRPAAILRRVSGGSMTSSTKPRSAAM